jgi:hypothetical protein
MLSRTCCSLSGTYGSVLCLDRIFSSDQPDQGIDALYVHAGVLRPIKSRSSGTEYGVLIGKDRQCIEFNEELMASFSCDHIGYINQRVPTFF